MPTTLETYRTDTWQDTEGLWHQTEFLRHKQGISSTPLRLRLHTSRVLPKNGEALIEVWDSRTLGWKILQMVPLEMYPMLRHLGANPVRGQVDACFGPIFDDLRTRLAEFLV